MVPFDIQRRYPCFGGLTHNGESLDNSKQRRGSNEPFQIDFFLVCQTSLSNKLPDSKKFSQHFCLNNHSNLFRVLFIRSEMPSDSKYCVRIFEQDAGSTCILEEI